MNFPKSIQQLCTPAYIYFLLSVIGIIVAIIQNVGNRRVYSLGSMSVPVPNTIIVFIVKIVAILFWTWILNLMCKDGHKEIAWFLVLLPFVLLFFMLGSMEGFDALSSYMTSPVHKYDEGGSGSSTTSGSNNCISTPSNHACLKGKEPDASTYYAK